MSSRVRLALCALRVCMPPQRGPAPRLTPARRGAQAPAGRGLSLGAQHTAAVCRRDAAAAARAAAWAGAALSGGRHADAHLALLLHLGRLLLAAGRCRPLFPYVPEARGSRHASSERGRAIERDVGLESSQRCMPASGGCQALALRRVRLCEAVARRPAAALGLWQRAAPVPHPRARLPTAPSAGGRHAWRRGSAALSAVPALARRADSCTLRAARQAYAVALVDGFHVAAAHGQAPGGARPAAPAGAPAAPAADSGDAARPGQAPGAPAPAPALLAAAARTVAAFLTRHVADGAVAGPDLRAALLASLGRLLRQGRYLAVFEASADARALLVRLVRPGRQIAQRV